MTYRNGAPDAAQEKSDETVSLRQIRRQLHELRRQAHRMGAPALAECLTLALTITAPRNWRS